MGQQVRGRGQQQHMILQEFYNLEESSGHGLQGSFTRDLTTSKLWLMQELAKIKPSVSTMYILGSWFGNLALYITLDPVIQVDRMINVEINPDMLNQSRRMLNKVGADNVQYLLTNANQLDYNELDADSVVVNSSLNDIAGTNWFRNIPRGTTVVLQGRDQVQQRQYRNTQDIMSQFPLNRVLYQGTMKLEDPETPYQRCMVIGQK